MLIVGNLLADLLLKAVDPRIGWKILTSGELTGFNLCFRKFITSSAPEPTVVIWWHIPTRCWTSKSSYLLMFLNTLMHSAISTPMAQTWQIALVWNLFPAVR